VIAAFIKRMSKSWQLSIISGTIFLIHRNDPVNQSYDAYLGRVKYTYLLGLIPVIGYKVEL
jgi:hypothetical protein